MFICKYSGTYKNLHIFPIDLQVFIALCMILLPKLDKNLISGPMAEFQFGLDF